MKIKASVQTYQWRVGSSEEEEDFLREEMRAQIVARTFKVHPFSRSSSFAGMALLFLVGVVLAVVFKFPEINASAWDTYLLWLGSYLAWSLVLFPFLSLIGAAVIRRFGHLLSNWDWWVEGYSKEIPPDLHVRERVETPIEIELDMDGDPPALCWWATGEPMAIHAVLKPVGTNTQPLPEGSALPVDLEGSVSLSKASRPAFDVTRSSEREGVLFVACRSKAPGKEASQVVFACPRPAWMGDARFDALPVMERVGIELDPHGAEQFLLQIGELSEAIGRPIEALANRTIPAYATVEH